MCVRGWGGNRCSLWVGSWVGWDEAGGAWSAPDFKEARGLCSCLLPSICPGLTHLLTALNLGQPSGKGKRGKKRWECVPTKQLHPCPSTLSNFQLGFQLTRDVRPQVGQAVPRGFPDTRRASDYLVITPFIASLQVTTFWQAFPWKGPFPAPGSQHRQGNRQACWVLLLQPRAIARPTYPLAPPRLATSWPCSKAPLLHLHSWLAGPVGHARTTPPTQHRPSSQFLPCNNGEGPARVSGSGPLPPDLP